MNIRPKMSCTPQQNTNSNNEKKTQREKIKFSKKHMTATAINTVITKKKRILQYYWKATLILPATTYIHTHKTATPYILIVEWQQKSRYTTHNHNIMLIFFEFNLNILNFLSLRL